MRKGLLLKLLLLFIGLTFFLMPISNALGFGFVPGPDPPADTTPPTVDITSHSTGAKISGEITVRANANDNVGVTKVSFALGSINLGYDDDAPYEKSYDIANADISFNDGNYLLKAIAFDAAGNYAVDQISVQVVRILKHAVIVGISDYMDEDLKNLDYCDEDATDWFNHLSGSQMDYDNIKVYGDANSGNYPQYDGIAKESIIKQALANMVNIADENDIIAFITSGHGDGDGAGSSYICAWDWDNGMNGEDGYFYDTELAAILDDAIAERIFVFIDHCYSGGFGPDLMSMGNGARVYCTTTCTEDGVGYDVPSQQNGAWTYYFLVYGWIDNFHSSATTSMESVFNYAHEDFPHSNEGNDSQQYDGNTSTAFYMA